MKWFKVKVFYRGEPKTHVTFFRPFPAWTTGGAIRVYLNEKFPDANSFYLEEVAA